jgi:hypothetical protein
VKTVLLGATLVAAVLVPAASARSAPHVKLALVALPKSALGPAAHSLALAHDSGAVSNAEAANSAFLATTTTLKSLGRVTGSTLDYGDPYSGKAGITAVQTGVDRYRTGKDAKRGLAFWKDDDGLIVPLTKDTEVSVRLRAVKLRRIGSARFALALTITVPGHARVTLVDAQAADGSYVLQSETASGSPAAAKSLASKLLGKLDRRLRLAVAGRLHAKPVKLPPALKAGPPKGGPDLASLALTAADLGQATVRTARYSVDEQALSDYGLDMGPAGRYDDLSQQIEWYASPNDATFLASFGGAVFTNTLAAILGRPGTTTTTVVDVSGVGDGARAWILRSAPKTGAPVYLAVIVLVRGQATDLIVTQSTSAIQDPDVTSLAQAAANHLDAGVPA